MSLRTLSITPPLVSLFFFSAFVVAGVNVTANCTSSSFSWTFNSLGQSPCTVAAYMFATCNEGSYTILSLPSGYHYVGPTPESSNRCLCSTVGYSLLSACVACQEEKPISWFDFVANCTSTLPPSQFPNPVPAGVYVPHWAILDVTNENNWNANESYAAGDGPEYGPGAILGSSASTSSTSTYSASAYSAGGYSVSVSSSSASSTTPPTPSHSGSHAGTIGGVLGSTGIISIAVAAILYLRRKRSQAGSPDVDASQPMLNNGTVAQPSPRPPLTMKLYNPNDPTTFPGYHAGPRSLDIHPASQVTLPQRVGSGSTRLDMQTSQTHTRVYRGLPMPSA
ncbi:hypothetical protein BGY98DRAFT_372834 [Russula aff. rugulosa BPL654]|nr:hypothetical protein BGY98DRAFT_372834 [Russula aff. rugulosa BPL654]